MKILVPANTELDLTLPDDVVVVPFREGKPVPSEHLDAEAVVAWGAAPASLASMAGDMPNLRWVQSLAAGVDSFTAAGIPARVTLTSGRGLHDYTVSEHALALLTSLVRQMPQYYTAQKERRWLQDSRGPKPLQPAERVGSIIDSRVLIWGFGSIGKTLAPILTAMGAQVRGVARSTGQRAGYDVIDVANIADELGRTDILIMILPSDPSTDQALNAELIDALPNRSLVVNVGRGSTVDEAALVAALNEGRLAGAGLDVMATEPLPDDSPLWTATNTVITPHVGGFRAHGAVELITANLEAFRSGGELRNVVER